MPEITKGRWFETKSYGFVTYEGKRKSKRGATGECHKFKTMRGKMKYITNEELRAFLDS